MALDPTLQMRLGNVLQAGLKPLRGVFPEANPYGQAIENFFLQPSEQMAGQMAEGYPHAAIDTRAGRPLVNPAVVDTAGLIPAATAAKGVGLLAKLPPEFYGTVVPMLGASAGLGRLNRASPDNLTPAQAALMGAMSSDPRANVLMTGYHGTPHRFLATERNPLGEFDLSQVGTGEGAQAYGHGIYVAENPSVAKDYRVALSSHLPSKMSGGGVDVEVPAWLREKIDAKGIDVAIAEWTSRIKKMDEQLANPDTMQPWIIETNRSRMTSELDAMQKIKASGNVTLEEQGHLYKIDIPDEVIDNQMLDWDEPIEFDSPMGQKIVNAYVESLPVQMKQRRIDELKDIMGAEGSGYEGQAESGKAIYQYLSAIEELGSDKNASKFLNSIGIKGIKYKDQFSRGKEGGTRNFVLFDPDVATIIGRN